MNIFKVIKAVKDLSQIDISTDLIKGHEIMGSALMHGTNGFHVDPLYAETVTKESIFLYTDLKNNIPYSFSVLFHELAHATGAKNRLNRRGIGHDRPFYGSRYGNQLEEQIAETTALKLMEYFKLSTDETRQKSLNYLGFYAYSGIENMLFDSNFLKKIDSNIAQFNSKRDEEVEKAFNYILNYWLKDFDPKCINERLEQRYKEFNKYF